PFSGRMQEQRREWTDGPFPRKVGAAEGTLDTSECAIAGWAWDREQPDVPVNVDIYEGEVLLTTVPAKLFRRDLLHAGIGNGRHAFHFPIPENLKDGTGHFIRARISGAQTDIRHTPKQFICR